MYIDTVKLSGNGPYHLAVKIRIKTWKAFCRPNGRSETYTYRISVPGPDRLCADCRAEIKRKRNGVK
jgi:hypothetical protein